MAVITSTARVTRRYLMNKTKRGILDLVDQLHWEIEGVRRRTAALAAGDQDKHALASSALKLMDELERRRARLARLEARRAKKSP